MRNHLKVKFKSEKKLKNHPQEKEATGRKMFEDLLSCCNLKPQESTLQLISMKVPSSHTAALSKVRM